MTIWYRLDEKLPEGEQCVLLFPIISDVGIVYTVSNPVYARLNAIKNGYTHWAAFDPHPNEKEQYEFNATLYEEE